MGALLILLLVEICLTANALSLHGSADTDESFPWRWLLKPSIVHPSRLGKQPVAVPDQTASHMHPLSFSQKRHGKLVAPPLNRALHHKWPLHHTPAKVIPSSIALPPSMSFSGGPARKWVQGPVSSPSISYYKHHHRRSKFNSSAPQPVYKVQPPTYSQQGPSVFPFPPSRSWNSPAPAPALSATSPTSHYNMPTFQPSVSPVGSSFQTTKTPPPSPVLALPPPPPNEDCSSVTCTEPLTYTPPGSPCGCVQPIQVKLRLGVAIYTFFPLVSELAEEIAASVSLNHSQVRVMGADADSQQLDKTAVLINLVPKVKFKEETAFGIYRKFWRGQVSIKAPLFGDYEVLNIQFPGLPPSPPSAPFSISTIDNGPHAGKENPLKPLGVDVTRRRNDGLGRSMLAVIVLSSVTAFIVCLGVVWLLLLKYGPHVHQPEHTPQALTSTPAKETGVSRLAYLGSTQGSRSMSFSSGTMTYTGSAKTFTLNDIERATNNFDASRILGEGGFGLVYSGILDDGREVAVKILKRDDHHGGREFLAEVEMLSRLHHRNLVKLIGTCTEEQTHCLVYELVPNGSVESHLHGVDKETDPLDWDARMKIALGAARGLAYLHEDSNPRVIHRDFKSSNILLEHDFTPKVSDFGLARTALEEGNRHISTHVMGTFGYLAPEYAMTGHLLVKSDVYSYGVVLLELITGRKPVDLSQPPGQENLVAWARPLLTSKVGLETIIDPAIRSQISSDSLTKVAAIASMCVQPEVSHRPFMGEVVQALKLVCNEIDETKGLDSRCCSQEAFLVDADSDIRVVSGEIMEASQSHDTLPEHGSRRETRIPLSTSDLLSASVGVEGQEFGSFRRYSSSGPLKTGRRKQFWQRLKGLSRGSTSEHGFSLKLWPESR
ncbi:receptor-like serine/threonine-protein kinase ALE2 [Ziziphus jujuba]|uniref:Receptor-like serine/threonine-protein kinase ALE2 n=1 Tax=Ziziphus jujuba TaxID=326968 RepID=A0ABM3I3R0_ZIZJJ|nr:receptor-like serine/threonine-protein kinase ALE2 [Ziziphus jujuba]